MSGQIRSSRRVRFLLLETACWAFLVPGLFLVGKSTHEMLSLQHMTANFLYWSSAGLLLMLVGWLLDPINSKG
jgi:hypothetical protein